MPPPLEAERGRSFSIDLTATVGAVSTPHHVPFRVPDPVHVERTIDVPIRNSDRDDEYRRRAARAPAGRPFALTGSYTFVRGARATRRTLPTSRSRRATPPASSRCAEWEDAGGSASSATTPASSGSRRTRTATSEPYVIVGLLAERRFGRFRLFINGENLTGVRQTRVDPLIRPARRSTAAGPWTPGRRSKDARLTGA